MKHIVHWLALTQISGFTIEGALAILHEFGSFEKAWKADECVLESLKLDRGLGKAISVSRHEINLSKFERQVHYCKRNGIKIVAAISEGYPQTLHELVDSPSTLFIKGDQHAIGGKMIAIVGTRDPSNFGRRKTREIASGLVEKDYRIVSGLALGVDACAHEGALDAKGITIAVLPSPLHDIVPKGNLELSEKILDSGGVLISEYGPEDAVVKTNFVKRNRIIAALSETTIIIEGTRKSGTRHQARYASQLGRPILVLEPDNPNIEQAELPLILAREGARLIEKAEDVYDIPKSNNNVTYTQTRLDRGEF